MITPESMLILIVTERCNLKCSYCLRAANDKENEISFDELEPIILKAYSFGYRNMGITGGEPLLYSGFDELIRLLGKLRFHVFLETNGYLLDEECIVLLRSHLGGNVEFLTSLDSYQEKTNDLLRGEGAYSQALKTIKLIKDSGFKLNINTVVTPHNLNSEEDVMEHIHFTRCLGTDNLFLSAAVPLGRAQERTFFVPPRQIRLINTILERNNFFSGYVTGHTPNFSRVSPPGCRRLLHRTAAISPRGIHPCVYQENIKIGELSDFEDLMADANFMDSFDDLRRASLTDYHSPFIGCQDCMEAMSTYLGKLKKLVTQ